MFKTILKTITCSCIGSNEINKIFGCRFWKKIYVSKLYFFIKKILSFIPFFFKKIIKNNIVFVNIWIFIQLLRGKTSRKNTDLWLLGYHYIQRQNQLRFHKSENKHVTTSFEIT